MRCGCGGDEHTALRCANGSRCTPNRSPPGRRYRSTLLALCCLLLAQWSLLTHACPVIKQAGDLIAQAELAAELAAADCHGTVMATPDHELGQPTLYLKHCADEGSASNGAGLVFTAAAAPPLVLRVPLASGHVPLHWERAPARSDATAPPLSILYCLSLT